MPSTLKTTENSADWSDLWSLHGDNVQVRKHGQGALGWSMVKFLYDLPCFHTADNVRRKNAFFLSECETGHDGQDGFFTAWSYLKIIRHNEISHIYRTNSDYSAMNFSAPFCVSCFNGIVDSQILNVQILTFGF